MPNSSAPTDPAGLPAGLDPLVVGRSIFGGHGGPPPPEVEGYSGLSFLAEGGFGRVWRANRDADDIPVALKIPHQADPETCERLEAEASALHSLRHPNIVRLLDVTVDSDGTPVLVMELVDGEPLTASLPEEGYEFEHALQIFLPILDAVAHAHDRGIVHRDLKPSNILLSEGRFPRVSDFGLAQSLRDQRVAFSLTRCGALAGTVEYLAPERYEPDAKASVAADIFALGVILYEMLTGRPPRGAWVRLSELRRLDVRLDEVLAEAMHPDPSRRLPSAGAFRRRLEEIRDSRPRYAGAPLVTRPVRVADAVWTLGGLYCLAAAYCSLLRINNTEVPAVFDLTFGHTWLLGGFWALWVLTLAMGILWGWQTFRLWRFRRVPLREALPSPLGLRLGSSRRAAVAVGLTQLLCGWAPLFYILFITSQVWTWATPDTPLWEKRLAITRWGSEEPVSMWTWDPDGMFSGDEFWVREMQPGFVDKTWQLRDRQSFLVVTQPLILTVSAAAIGLGILATATAAAGEWRRRRPVSLLFLCAVLAALPLYARSTFADARHARTKYDHKSEQHTKMARERRLRALMPVLHASLDAVYRGADHPPALLATALAPSVSIADGQTVPREAALAILEQRGRAATAAHQTTEQLHTAYPVDRDGRISLEQRFECYGDPPDSPPTGRFMTVRLEYRDDPDPVGCLLAWRETSEPLYTAETRSFTPGEAEAWLGGFLSALGGLPAESTLALDAFFLPVILATDPEKPLRFIPTPRSVVLDALRESAATFSTLRFTSRTPPKLRPLPGGRWELTCNLRSSGTRTGFSKPHSARLFWQLELVHTADRWQILRLRM